MIKNKYLLLATSIMGCIATMPVCATECVVGDCASLGYSQGDVPNCKKYVSCPFDTSYKTCVEYNYPYVPCPVGYNTSVTEETCTKAQKLKTTTGLNGVTCGACECKYTDASACENASEYDEPFCHKDKYGCYYEDPCPKDWNFVYFEDDPTYDEGLSGPAGVIPSGFYMHFVPGYDEICPAGTAGKSWIDDNLVYCEYGEYKRITEGCYECWGMGEECDEDGENCVSVNQKSAFEYYGWHCVKDLSHTS